MISGRLDATDKKSRTLSKTLSNIGGGELLVAGVAVTALAGSSIKAGSDLNETLSKTQVVLGDAADEVIAWSKTTATSLGQSQQAALDSASTFALFGKSAGLTGKRLADFATETTGLATDMASFFNTSPEQAVEAIGAAFRGESEPIRKYNVLLDDATLRQQAMKLGLIATTKQALTPQQKVLAAHAEILRQTSDAQGDFARTSEGLANQQRINSARFADFQAQLGGVLIPALLNAQNAAFGLANGLQSANDASGGFLGKAALFAAAIPVGAFALDKLAVGGTAVVNQFSKVGDMFRNTADAAQVASGAESVLAAVHGSRAATLVPLITLQQAEVAATLQSVAADKALSAVQYELATSSNVDSAALVRLTAASDAAAVAQANLARAQAAAAAGSAAPVVAGPAVAASIPAIGGFIAAGLALGHVLRNIGDSATHSSTELKTLSGDLLKGGEAADKAQQQFAKVLGSESAAELQQYSQQLIANASASDLNATKAQVLAKALAAIPGYLQAVDTFGKNAADSSDEFGSRVRTATLESEKATGALRELTKQYGAAAIQSATLTAAQKKYADDIASGSASTAQLAEDKAAVVAASRQQALVENQVSEATNTGAKAADGAAKATVNAANAADKARFAYLGLGSGVDTAAQALDAISSKAFGRIEAQIAADTSRTNVAAALQELNNPDTGSSGGGGGGQSAVAQALEQAEKEIALRDAKRGVTQATQDVEDAEKDLTQARKDATAATKAVADAQENLRTVLKGVSRDSIEARDALDAFAAAENAASGAKLDVNDAKRALAQAKLDAKSGRLSVGDAQTNLSKAIEDEAGPEEVAKATIALKSARLQASAGADNVARAELALSNAQLAAKDSTKAQKEAQRDLNGTLNGYPPASREAKAAQEQLTTAQAQARSAVDAVKQAQQQLTTAQYGTRDSALALIRAQADLDGKLESSSGASSAGRKLDSLTTRVNNARLAIIQLAKDAAAADRATGGSFGHSILVQIQTLQALAAANPLLAGAFDSALKELESKFAAQLVQQKKRGGIDDGILIAPGIVRRAGGGSLAAGQPAWVGEEGVELFVPNVDGTIVPNHSLANSRPVAGAFGGVALQFNAPIYGFTDFQRQVISALEQHNGGYLPRSIKTSS